MKRKVLNIFFFMLFAFFQAQSFNLLANPAETKVEKKEIEKLVKETIKDLQLKENLKQDLHKALQKDLNSKFLFSLILFLITGTLAILFLYFERKKLIYQLSSGIFRRIKFSYQEQLNQKVEKTIKEQTLMLLNPANTSLSRLESSMTDLSSQIKEIKSLSPNLLFVGENYLREKNYQAGQKIPKPIGKTFESSVSHLSLVEKRKNEEQKPEPIVKRKRGRPRKNKKPKENLNFEEIKGLIENSNLKEANSQFSSIEASNNNYSEQEESQLLFLKSLLEHKKENHTKALELIESSLKLDPYFIEAWNKKGILFDQLGQHHKAIECYQKAVQLKSRLKPDKIII